MKKKLTFGRFDFAAWSVFVAYASASLAVPIVLVQMANELKFPLLEGGMAIGGVLQMGRSVAMCLAMALSGFMAAKWGNRRPVALAVFLMAFAFSIMFVSNSWQIVLLLLLFAGLGEGIIEGLATPFVQTLHDEDQGQYVNISHGFWSLGTFGFVLIAGILLIKGVSWRYIMLIVSLISVIPILLLTLPAKRPYPEQKIGKSSREVLKDAGIIARNKKFWFFFAAMIFAGGGEYCLTFWAASFIQLNFASTALMGAIGTAAFAAGMFLGRTTFGALIPQSGLKKLIVIVGIFGALVTMIIPPFTQHLSLIPQWAILPLLLTILFLSGIGSAPFWPSIQSLTVDRLPHLDSTLAFIILSCAGVPGCGIFTWLMGVVGDHAGLANSFYLVPLCYLLMTVLVLIAAPGKGNKKETEKA